MGIVCPLGQNVEETVHSLERSRTGLHPLTRFQTPHHAPLPVGEVISPMPPPAIPATHELARAAADQAMSACTGAPDAIVIGGTTGGIATTENLLKAGCQNAEDYQYHGLGSVAADLAKRYECSGPVITVSTACSSGTAAIAVAAALLDAGLVKRVLTGGVDSLCRLTYFGFKSLQLIDPEGSRPLDRERAGLSVAEGAGMLLVEAANEKRDEIQILGAGFSCDAHHPTQPHPQGRGALAAMGKAINSAGLATDDVDYINLHGTGTEDNDRSEAAALKTLFGERLPPVSSVKGATGHSLAGAGAVEAVISALAIDRGLIPANSGCRMPDPDLGLEPVLRPTRADISTVLSNSFGFGGNNAAIVLGRTERRRPEVRVPSALPLYVMGWAAATGAGPTDATLERLKRQQHCRGVCAAAELGARLPPRMIRRAKRLSIMAMALAAGTLEKEQCSPEAVFFGTGWGSLSETHDFLKRLFETREQLASPTDFIGSVHNAPAGQVALLNGVEGANITVSGGNASFEQALLTAQLLAADDAPVLVLGADEGHKTFSPLFDPSVAADDVLSDGGGALLLGRAPVAGAPSVELKHFETGYDTPPVPDPMVSRLGGGDMVKNRYGLVLVGIPAAENAAGRSQLQRFLVATGYRGPVLEYRRLIGEFATASAVATVLAAALVKDASVSRASEDDERVFTGNQPVLVLGLGSVLTAIEVAPA